ncbi:MAG: LysM peptidoglycan-binding domain-containing protein [Anaeromyxobacter sp.]
MKAYTSSGSDGAKSVYNVEFKLFDAYKEGVVTGYREDNANNPGTTTDNYDVNGFLIGLDDSTKDANDRRFINDAQGKVLMKVQEGRVLRQLVVDGNVLGVYGEGTDQDKPVNSSGNPNYTVQGEFGLTYQAITNAYPSAAVGSYQVRAGDTIKSIAQAAYGDTSLWYVIADANGLRGDSDLRVGQTVTIPNGASGSKNNSTTFQPYDPSRVVGSTSPNLPIPAANKGCGVIGTILVVVVTVIATIYTAGAAAIAMNVAGAAASSGVFAAGAAVLGGSAVAGATGIGATMAVLGAAAIGGAVGSLAGQMVGVMTGMQKEISWGAVATSAISNVVTAGVGGALNGAGDAAKSWYARAAFAATKATISNAATQGVSLAVGLQKDFNWSSVAASAVGAAVGSAASEATNSAIKYDPSKGGFDFGKSLVSGTVSGFAAGMTTAVMRGGKIAVQQVAADAFGNAFASAVSGQAQADGAAESERKLRAQAFVNEAMKGWALTPPSRGPEFVPELKLKFGLGFTAAGADASTAGSVPVPEQGTSPDGAAAPPAAGHREHTLHSAEGRYSLRNSRDAGSQDHWCSHEGQQSG